MKPMAVRELQAVPPCIGEHFILGFRGEQLPAWLGKFAAKYALGGVVLFDYDCAEKTYQRNISSPAQLQNLCSQLASLPSQPLICVDQEGGVVRRLKSEQGFAPYPSAKDFSCLPLAEKISLTHRSFSQMCALGIHYNFAPVIDLHNDNSPNIGTLGRAYSATTHTIKENINIINSIAAATGLCLCLKHFPGIGKAHVDSHTDLLQISVCEEQLALFYYFVKRISGKAVMLSHAFVQEWDKHYPLSMSANCVRRLRAQCPDALLITDDMQMQSLQKIYSTDEASVLALHAGVDMLLIGNNLLHEEEKVFSIAENILAQAANNKHLQLLLLQSQERIRARKSQVRQIICKKQLTGQPIIDTNPITSKL